MKVGILTYHYVYNEGAIWQAYSLCRHLRSVLAPHQVEIVDYRHPAHQARTEAIFDAGTRELYDRALNGLVGDRRIVTDDPEAFFDILNGTCDACVVGSDIVWQFDFRRGVPFRLKQAIERHVFPRLTRQPVQSLRVVWHWLHRVSSTYRNPPVDAPPFPNVYWLAEPMRCRKFSYAPSAGYSDPGRIPRAHRGAMREALRSFDLLSVRDTLTRDLLAQLDPALASRTTVVPDPAWLFDDPLPDVRPKLTAAGVDLSRRRAGIVYPRRGRYTPLFNDTLVPRLKERGLQVVAIIDSNDAADVDLTRSGLCVWEWWAAVREMDFLLTIRTHPNIAALKYETPFFNIDVTAMYKESSFSKSADMLAGLGLEDFCVHDRRLMRPDTLVARLDRALDASWDWAAIGARTAAYRRRCEQYALRIRDALNAQSR